LNYFQRAWLLMDRRDDFLIESKKFDENSGAPRKRVGARRTIWPGTSRQHWTLLRAPPFNVAAECHEVLEESTFPFLKRILVDVALGLFCAGRVA